MVRDELGIYVENTIPVNGTQLGDILDHADEGDTLTKKYPIGGHQRPLKLVIIVREDLATATSVAFKLNVSDTEAFTANRDIVTGPAIPAADFKKGVILEYPIPAAGDRFSRVMPVVVGTAATAGKVDAFLAY